jgi:hypothetical protein
LFFTRVLFLWIFVDVVRHASLNAGSDPLEAVLSLQ